MTRFGIGLYNADRLDKMLSLFEAVTLNSIQNQKEKNFFYLIVVDSNLPEKILLRLNELIKGDEKSFLVSIDITQLTNVHTGSFNWVWDKCQDFILKNELIDCVDEYIITSNLDADDAWRLDMISSVNIIVNQEIKSIENNISRRPTWTRHSPGLAITFPHGYNWFIEKNHLKPIIFDFPSMSVFIVSKFSSGISCCSSRHAQWGNFSMVVQFEIIREREDQAMWLYSLHDEQVTSWSAHGASEIFKKHEQIFYADYGINEKKIKEWIKRYSVYNIDSFEGKPAAEKYNLIFRITYLNRALRAYHEKGDKNLNIKIIAVEKERLACIDELNKIK
jgi:hypothetical protein